MKGAVLRVALASLCLSLAWAAYDSSVCNLTMFPVPPPMPILTSSHNFSATVVWRELLTQQEFKVTEYYDGNKQRATLYIQMPPQERVKVIFNLANKTAVVIRTQPSGTKTCTVMDGEAGKFQYDGKPWLTSIRFLYDSMLQTGGVVFVGNRSVPTVRGSPVKEWDACSYDNTTDRTSNMRMFFTTDKSWFIPFVLPGESRPMSVMLHTKSYNGSRSTEYNVTGDVVDFTPYPLFPEDVFTVDMYCPNMGRGPQVPFIPYYFYMLMEVIDMDYHRITYEEIWYDSEKNLARYDTKSAIGSDADAQSIIYDFRTGVRYSKDTYLGTCNADRISIGDKFTASNMIHLNDRLNIFHIDPRFTQYGGEITTRGVQCDLWNGIYLDTLSNVNSSIKWYFTKRQWVEAAGDVTQPGSFFRMDIWRRGSPNPIIKNIHKYISSRQRLSSFDVGDCYAPKHKIYFVIQFIALNNSYNPMLVSKPYMRDTMQEELAALIIDNPLRLANLRVEYDDNQVLYVSANLLDVTPVINDQLLDPKPQHDLITLFGFLEGRMTTRSIVMLKGTTSNTHITLQSQRILNISFPVYFTTTTVPTTSSTAIRTPPMPVVITTGTPGFRTPPIPTLKPPSTKLTSTTTSSTVTTRQSSTHRVTIIPQTKVFKTTVNGVTQKCSCPSCTCQPKQCPPTSQPCKTSAKQPVTSPSSGSRTCTCPKSNCSTRTAVTTPCPTLNTFGTQKSYQSQSSISKGALGAAIVVSLLFGALLCFLVVVVVNRFRPIALLHGVQRDTETIPLGSFSP